MEFYLMHNDSLLYKLLAAAIMLLFIITAALPAVMQDNTAAAPPPDDAFQLTGMLESISTQEVVIDGVAVDIRLADLNTRLTLGDTVRVEGNLNEGVFTARSIGPPAAQNPTPSGSTNESSGSRDTFELRGVVESVGDGFVIVSGQQVNIANLNRQVPLTIGQLVRVRGVVENGFFSPRMIQTSNDGGSFDDDLDNPFDDDRRDLNIPADCTVTAPAGWVSYTIRPGESLSSIAARSGSSVSEVVRVNCLSNPRMIIAGTIMWLPRIPANFPGANRGNESSGSRSVSFPNHSGSGGSNESSGSNSRSTSSRPSGGNESSGSNSVSSGGGSSGGNESSGSNSSSSSASGS